MESFSQRQGIKPIKSIVQIDSMDNDLRNSLWNALTLCYWDGVKDYNFSCELSHTGSPDVTKKMCDLIIGLWVNYFLLPVDDLPDYHPSLFNFIKSYFFECEWNEVYDFIEFFQRLILMKSKYRV